MYFFTTEFLRRRGKPNCDTKNPFQSRVGPTKKKIFVFTLARKKKYVLFLQHRGFKVLRGVVATSFSV
jgi:hypothetical protein